MIDLDKNKKILDLWKKTGRKRVFIIMFKKIGKKTASDRM
jgi:hypothetical protein